MFRAPMGKTITMVKKQLLSGEPCKKCAQAEEMLRNRGLWERIDRVVWAKEGQPESEGMRLGAEHGVELAPFFIVEEAGGAPVVYTSAIKFVKEQFGKASGGGEATGESESVEQLASRLEQATPRQIVEYALKRFGERCAISFSGAEDVVLIDMATKLGLPFSVFSLDTGRLHPETYRFIDKVRGHYGLEIELVSPQPQRLEPMVRQKGLFSFYTEGHGECCGIRKVEPLRRVLANFDAWITGRRKDQSVTRAELPVVDLDDDGVPPGGSPRMKFNPLANWTSKRTWDYIQVNEVPYNELHDRGFVSIGCEPCTRAVRPGEHERAGRWWWEEETQRECGLHVRKG